MKIRIKSGDCPEYLTMGKVYQIMDTFLSNLLVIVDDFSNVIYVKINNCIHLGLGSWEIVND